MQQLPNALARHIDTAGTPLTGGPGRRAELAAPTTRRDGMEGIQPLLAPLATLAAQGAEYDWAGHDELRLDSRYRTRQLPLLHDRPRAALGPDTGPGEYWPPVRSIVVPIDGHLVAADPQMRAFLTELARSAVGKLVWWQGLVLRADRTHATLVPDNQSEPDPDPSSGGSSGGVMVLVRGPWIGRMNTGRIYLPVQAADRHCATYLAQVRARAGAERRPLLAGYLQLTGAVTGAGYRELRDLVATYQSMAIPMPVRQLWVMDTMDDLVLRSEVTARIPLTANRAPDPMPAGTNPQQPSGTGSRTALTDDLATADTVQPQVRPQAGSSTSVRSSGSKDE
ncbi:hypothetical protein AB0J86_33530 [Micromonospora sp. NPDC049559]|uniref:hypothetical protein n=1 Tax=Micromonospora sp. NPDC049559 TaxID=3155923 RepID=UPI003426926B